MPKFTVDRTAQIVTGDVDERAAMRRPLEGRRADKTGFPGG